MRDSKLIYIFFNLTLGINHILNEQYSFEELEFKFENFSIEFGGRWKPVECKSEFKIAIIVPYRDRLLNLKQFLLNMHPFLIRQSVEYGIFLIEPFGNLTFNRGLLMNVGFLEATKQTNEWNCFFFHDVDMLPESNLNLYKCDLDIPLHYAVAVNKFDYK